MEMQGSLYVDDETSESKKRSTFHTRRFISRHTDKVFEIENCVRHTLFENEGDV